MDTTTLFCEIDDFCKIFLPNNPEFKLICYKNTTKKTRNRPNRMSVSEIMTIVILFQTSGYRNFKHFYLTNIMKHSSHMFPSLLSYSRFISIMYKVLMPLCAYLKIKLDKPTGISYVDATKIEVCNKKRISRNKVFKGIGKIGKTSMGWFFGFKLHIIINHLGGLLSVKITPGNISDSKAIKSMTNDLFGKLFGDKGYISKGLSSDLLKQGVQLITPIRSNMKNKLVELKDKILLRKRAVIETINDQLKNIYQVDHTRHRSVVNFMVNLISGLTAYTFRDKKPSISDSNLDAVCSNINLNGDALMVA